MCEANDTYNQQPSSYFVEKGSYLRLENVQLGYTLPKHTIKRLGINNLRVYVMATNLFTITGYSGLDPAIQTSDNELGIDYGVWPTPKRYFIGVDIDI